MVDFENFNFKFESIVNSPEWKKLEKLFKEKKTIFMFGNGGNMGVTDHAAVDQMSAPDLCGKFNGMNARFEVSNVLPRGLLRGCCTRPELEDVVFSSAHHRPVVQGKAHEFLGDAH